jgi:hypothetical protein
VQRGECCTHKAALSHVDAFIAIIYHHHYQHSSRPTHTAANMLASRRAVSVRAQAKQQVR